MDAGARRDAPNEAGQHAARPDLNEVRLYGEHHGIWQLTTPRWEADEVDGWEMASIAGYVLQSKGAYRMPDSDHFRFAIFDAVEWLPAQLAEEDSVDTWRQWVYRWDARPGDHRVAVRATDGTGAEQIGSVVPPFPNGATGDHTIEVRVS